MNYTLRDKSGKNLGSFDLASLIQMVKASRLKGDEDYLAPNSAWLPIHTIPELSSHLPTNLQSGLEPQAPDNLMNIFNDLNDAPAAGASAPDFTLPGSPAELTSMNTPPPAPPPPSAAPASSVSFDELWADDEGKPVNTAAPAKSPPPARAAPTDKTMVGPPPSSAPAAPAPSVDLSFELDAPAPPAKNDSFIQHDPLGDLLQDSAGKAAAGKTPQDGMGDDLLSFPDPVPTAAKSAPPVKSAPKKPAQEDSLEDLFSAPQDKPSAPAQTDFAAPAIPSGGFSSGSPKKAAPDSLDSLLNASPDAFASDLSMPDAPTASAPTPSVPAAKSTAAKAPARKSAPAAAPALIDEKSGSEGGKEIRGGAKAKSANALSALKNALAGKMKVIALAAIVVVVGAASVVVFLQMRQKAKTTLPTATTTANTALSTSSVTVDTTTGNPDERAKQLMDRDNYGLYLQAAKIEEEALAKDGSNLLRSATRLEALGRAEMRLNKADAAVLADMDRLAQQLAAENPPSAKSATALAALALTKGDPTKAKNILNQALTASSNDAALQGLLGIALLRESDFAGAQAAFQKSLAANPAHLPALYGLVQLNQKQNSPAAAVESALKRVLELSPSHVAARVDLGSLYVQIGDLAEAEKNLVLITGAQSKDASPPEIGKAYYQMGLILQKRGKTQEAIQQFNQAANVDPNNPAVQFELANILLQSGKIEDAKNRFMAAIQVEKRADFIVGYASALMAEKKFGDAMLWLQQAIRSEPQHAPSYLKMGLVQKALGNNDEAVSSLRKSQSLQSNNLDATLALGEIFMGLKKYDLAITEYRNALTIAPKDAGIHLQLGMLLYQKSQYANAATEYEKAIEYTTDLKQRGIIAHQLGDAYLADKNYDAAIEAQRKAVRLNPELVEASISLGVAYFKKGSYGESQETLEAVREQQNPQGELAIELNYNLANAYTETANYEKASQFYNLVLAQRPQFNVVHYQLGNLYYKQNAYLKAVEEFKIALPKLTSPEERYDTLLALGKSYQSLGENGQAEQTYLRTVKEFPQKSETYFRLAQIYDEQQAVKKAISFYEQTLKLNPKDDRAHFFLGFIYKAMNRPLDAVEHFRKALALNPHSKNADQLREEIELLSNRR